MPANSKSVRNIPFTMDFSDDPVLAMHDRNGCVWTGMYCLVLDIDYNTYVDGLPILLDSKGVSQRGNAKWMPFSYSSVDGLTAEECKAVLPNLKSLHEVSTQDVRSILGRDDHDKIYFFAKAKNGKVLCSAVQKTYAVQKLIVGSSLIRDFSGDSDMNLHKMVLD